jgi:hypothetical protein
MIYVERQQRERLIHAVAGRGAHLNGLQAVLPRELHDGSWPTSRFSSRSALFPTRRTYTFGGPTERRDVIS